MKTIKNSIKISDWSQVLDEFESLSRGLSKSAALIEKEGYPRNFIKGYAELEDAVETAWENREGRKKMNATAQRALSSLKQKLRKLRQSFEKDLETFRANPWETEDSSDERARDADASDDDDDADGAGADGQGGDEGDDGFTQAESRKTKKRVRKTEASDDAKADAFVPENVEKKLADVIQMRGKRNTDLKKQCDILRKLVEIADTPAVKVTCILLLVAIQFDRALSLVTYLPASEWTRCVRTGARASPPGPGLFWRATWEGRGGGAGNGWQKKK